MTVCGLGEGARANSGDGGRWRLALAKASALRCLCIATAFVLAPVLNTHAEPAARPAHKTWRGSARDFAAIPMERLLREDGSLDLANSIRGLARSAGWRESPGSNGAQGGDWSEASGGSYVGGRTMGATAFDDVENGQWDGRFCRAGVSGTVYSSVVDEDGDLYVGGDFLTAGSSYAPYIAKWDGTTWSALGSGMDGTVYALAVDGHGNLYAGGSFSTAGVSVPPMSPCGTDQRGRHSDRE